MQKWRSQFTGFFATTFKNHTHEHSVQNAAQAFDTGIVAGEYPAYYIYASKVVSNGALPGLPGLIMQHNTAK
ncbi:hypothetical protein DBR40_03565 [Pedobacter sp. KBW01]|nr:hypothetical protein DBR40_03565 [Pedobacter sp. KBW01]